MSEFPEEILIDRLESWSDLTALTGTRFSPIAAAPTVARPHVVYSRTSTSEPLDTAETNFDATMSFTIWADTYAEAKRVARRLREALRQFTGGDEKGVTVDSVVFEDENDNFQERLEGMERPLFGAVLTFKVTFTEH